ncbi:MAG: FMN-dependent NADH-azoreductase, partial [Deltaproteobacteria bacterium]
MKVLHIEASPMKGESFSSRAAEALISTLRETHPDWEVERLDLWVEEIPYFDGRAASGKYKVMRGLPHSPEEAEAWEKVKGEIERFSSADLVIISSPMWNFGIPFRLKQYLDVVIQPGLTFSFTPG